MAMHRDASRVPASLRTNAKLHVVGLGYSVVRTGLARPCAKDFQDYTFPSCLLDGSLLHLTHWPPKKPSDQSPSGGLAADFKHCYSLKLLTVIFPAVKRHEEIVMDMFCKRQFINDEDHSRKSDDDVYESEDLLEAHPQCIVEVLENSSTKVIVAWVRVHEQTYGIHALEIGASLTDAMRPFGWQQPGDQVLQAIIAKHTGKTDYARLTALAVMIRAISSVHERKGGDSLKSNRAANGDANTKQNGMMSAAEIVKGGPGKTWTDLEDQMKTCVGELNVSIENNDAALHVSCPFTSHHAYERDVGRRQDPR